MVHHQYGKQLFHNLLRYYAATLYLTPDWPKKKVTNIHHTYIHTNILRHVLLCKQFRRTNVNSSIPVKVKSLLSVLIWSRPQWHHHQVPPQCDIVAPNSDTCQRHERYDYKTCPHLKIHKLCFLSSPSPTVWWMMLSSMLSPSVPEMPMAGEKPSWKAHPWMYDSPAETLFKTENHPHFIF